MRVEKRRAPYAVARAFAATALVMGGALGAHTAAGGHLPDGSVLIALGALVLGCSLLAMRETTSRGWLLAAVAAAQVGLHTAFSAAPATHLHAGSAGEHATWSWQMLAAHAGVTLLTALVWRLCSRAAVVVVDLARLPAATVLPRLTRLPTLALPHGLPSRLCLIVAPRRGPPRLA